MAGKNRFGKPLLGSIADFPIYPFMAEAWANHKTTNVTFQKAQEKDFARFGENMRR